jgi:membrane protein DedA with SNARE-associated domain
MTLQHIIQLIDHYKYLVLFPIVVIEGPIISIVSGFLVSMHRLNIFATYAVLVVGDTLGDALYFWAGHGGRLSFLTHGMKNDVRLKKMERHFEKNAGRTLLIAKFTYFFGALTIVAAAIAKTPFKKFIAYSFFGTMVKTALLLLVGYYFGSAYAKIAHYLGDVTIFAISLVVLGVLAFVISRKVAERYLQ